MTLKQKAISSAKWTAISSIVTTALYLIQITVLARLLVPADFGLMAMVMIIIGFGQAYADMGISNAIIHRQDTTSDHLSSLYWVNIGAGFIVFILCLVVTPVIVQLFKEPRLSSLIPWASLVFLVIPLGQQFQILAQKELRFRRLAIIEISSQLLGVIIAILSAINGHGVYALIWGQLTNSLTKSLMLAITGWKKDAPRIHFKRKDLKGYLRFGIFQMGERSINYFNSYLDQLVLGILIGATGLGYYSFAHNLVIKPIRKINPVLTRVAFPVFAKIQNDNERLKRGYMTLRRLLSSVNFPILFGLSATAPVFIPVIFGEQWLPSIPILQILAFVAMFRSAGNPVGSLMLAKGRPDLGFRWNFMLLFTQIPGIYIGAKYYGPLGAAIALLVLQFIYFWGDYMINIKTLLGKCLSSHLGSILPALVTAGIMMIGVLFLDNYLNQDLALKLTTQVIVGAGLYLALNIIFFKNQFLQTLDFLRTDRKSIDIATNSPLS